MTGALACIDLNPAGTGSAEIISIAPSAAISAGSAWYGLKINGAALDPSGIAAYIGGVDIDFSGVDMTNNPFMRGIYVVMPAVYGAQIEYAGYFSGDGKVVKICDDTYALWVDAGNSRFDGIIYVGNGTTYYVNAAGVAKFNIAADDATYTGIVTSDSGILKYRTKAQVLSDIAASPVAGSASIVTVGTLTSGAIGAGFTVINKAYLDTDLLDAETGSPYTVEQDISYRVQFSGTQSTNLVVSNLGAYQNATGLRYMYFCVNPPDWLIRYCEDQGKTLTLTQIVCRWNNTVAADYITEAKYYWVDGNTANSTQLFADAASNWGQGSVGFRNDIFNGTDHTFTRGDWFYVRTDVQQGTVNSCRIKSFQATYTIA